MDYITHLYFASQLCTDIEKDEIIKPLLNKLAPYLDYLNDNLESFNICNMQEELKKIILEEDNKLINKYRKREPYKIIKSNNNNI